MFGKKEKTREEVPLPSSTRIDTIPTAFYGGADPLIYQTKESSSSVVSAPPPVPLPPPPAVPVVPKRPTPPIAPSVSKPMVKPEKTTLVQPPVANVQKKSPILLLLLAVFLLAVLIGGGYYFFVSKKQSDPIPFSPPVVKSTPVITVPVVTSTPTPTTTSPSIVATTTPTTTVKTRGGGNLVLPKIVFFRSPDNDADTLTNSEEEIFMTDPEVWDTDKDGYHDGLEVQNLYNPKGIAPQKIIDSGLAKEYINPIWQYRMYYPPSWRVDPVAGKLDDVLLSGLSGDYIEIRAFKKDLGVTFEKWFAAELPGEFYSGFTLMENRFQVNFYKRSDSQVAFFVTDTAVYSIVYFYGEEGQNLFPHIMEMLVQSFRPSKTPVELPIQPILPGVAPSSSFSTTSLSSSTVGNSSSSLFRGNTSSTLSTSSTQ